MKKLGIYLLVLITLLSNGPPNAFAQTAISPAEQQEWKTALTRFRAASSQEDIPAMKVSAQRLVEIAQQTNAIDFLIISHHNLGTAFSKETFSRSAQDEARTLLGQKAITEYAQVIALQSRTTNLDLRRQIGFLTNSNKAEMHYALGEYELAEKHWQKSIDAALETDNPALPTLLKNLGAIFYHPQISPVQKQRLLHYFAGELTLLKEKHKWEAMIWCGYSLAMADSSRQAIDELKSDLVFASRFDPHEEAEIRILSLHLLGKRLIDAGYFAEVLEVCDTEDKICARLFPRNPKDYAEYLAECRNNKAMALLNLGEFQAAKHEFARALQMKKFSPDTSDWPRIESNQKLADQIVRSPGSTPLTLEYAAKIVEGQADVLTQAGMALSLGGELREAGSRKEAKELFRNAQLRLETNLASVGAAPVTPLLGLKRLFLGALALEAGQWKQAADILDQARQNLQATGQDNALSFCFPLLAVAQENAGQTLQAEQTFAQAVTHFETRLAFLTAPEKTGLFQFARAATLYADYAHLLATTKRPEAALLMADRVRGRGMAQEARRIIEKTALTIKEKKERASQWISELRPDELKTLAHRFPTTLFLHYNLSREGVTLFAFGDSLPVHYWIVDRDTSAVLRLVNSWVNTLRTGGFQSTEQRYAASLGKILLTPLYQSKTLLPGGQKSHWQHIVIVPDGGLYNVPFAALLLPEQKTERVIDRFSISLTASLRQRARNFSARQATRSLLVVSDPRGDKPQSSPAKQAVGGFSETEVPLPEFGRLGEQITRLFSAGVTHLTARQATKKTVQALLPNYALLLFLTHGHAREEQSGLASYLTLAPEANYKDAYLRAGEIVAQPLAAQMALLLACETAQGRLAGGEGSQGMVWAFWAAGCPSVMASLWEIRPNAVSALLPLFLDGLRKGQPRDVALRTAILKMRMDFPSPKDWAAFQIYGDPGALEKESLRKFQFRKPAIHS